MPKQTELVTVEAASVDAPAVTENNLMTVIRAAVDQGAEPDNPYPDGEDMGTSRFRNRQKLTGALCVVQLVLS